MRHLGLTRHDLRCHITSDGCRGSMSAQASAGSKCLLMDQSFVHEKHGEAETVIHNCPSMQRP